MSFLKIYIDRTIHMLAQLTSAKNSKLNLSAIFTWLPVVIGLLALYVPTINAMAHDLWVFDDQAHGPIILAVVLYLIWQLSAVFSEIPVKTQPIIGGLSFVFGLLIYAIGRSQQIFIMEIGSMVPVLAGIVLITLGFKGLRKLWFPIFFTIFMIPLPGFIIDSVTGPLKHSISILAESFLYHLGYPIARSGVTISIGMYQLLVADACSGLHSMFSLSALGFLYLYMMRYRNLPRNIMLIASILPVAFIANLFRVIALILITYYFGDEVGQGFIHKFAGLFLFVISLLSLFAFDAVLGKFSYFKDQPKLANGVAS